MKIKGTDIKFFYGALKIFFINILVFLVIFIWGVTFYELVISVLFLFSFSIFCLIRNYRILHIYFQTDKPKESVIQKIESAEYIKSEDFPVYYKQGSDEYIDTFFSILETIKEEQKDLFVSKGFSFVIGDYIELKSMLGTALDFQGLFDASHKVILLCKDYHFQEIVISPNISKNIFEKVMYHEWGHFLDYANDYISQTSIVKKEYEIAKKKYIIYRDMKDILSFRKRMRLKLSFENRKFNEISCNEYKNVEEFLADNYSFYRIGKPYNTNLKSVFDIFEKIETIEQVS